MNNKLKNDKDNFINIHTKLTNYFSMILKTDICTKEDLKTLMDNTTKTFTDISENKTDFYDQYRKDHQ